MFLPLEEVGSIQNGDTIEIARNRGSIYCMKTKENIATLSTTFIALII